MKREKQAVILVQVSSTMDGPLALVVGDRRVSGPRVTGGRVLHEFRPAREDVLDALGALRPFEELLERHETHVDMADLKRALERARDGLP